MERQDYIKHVDILTSKVNEIRAYNTRIMRMEGLPGFNPIEEEKYDKMMKKVDDLSTFMYETSALSMKVADDRSLKGLADQTELKFTSEDKKNGLASRITERPQDQEGEVAE